MAAWGLTPEEDAELRRLHFMLRFGSVGERFVQRYLELRRKDRRIEVREPVDAGVVVPQPRTDADSAAGLALRSGD